MYKKLSCVTCRLYFNVCSISTLVHIPSHAVPYVLCPAGQLFPDNDPTWKGASSDIFVKEAVSAPGRRRCKAQMLPTRQPTNSCGMHCLIEANWSCINCSRQTLDCASTLGRKQLLTVFELVLVFIVCCCGCR
jgi:2C-methyl-D-erythritol 2,4-cyclodiphosphate synthase